MIFIIVTGSQHYALYKVLDIKNRKHISNLNISDCKNVYEAKNIFKKLLSTIYDSNDFEVKIR